MLGDDLGVTLVRFRRDRVGRYVEPLLKPVADRHPTRLDVLTAINGGESLA
jgi:hypothetical protein